MNPEPPVQQAGVVVAGQCKYLYRTIDRDGDTIDFPLAAHRDSAAARRFFERAIFERAIDRHGVPENVAINKSGVDTSAPSQFYSLAF